MFKKISACALLITLFSCASNPGGITNAGKLVKVVPSEQKKSSCEVVGSVTGESSNGSVEMARNDARNQVAKLAGTHIFFKEEIQNGKDWSVHGIGYQCK